MSVLYNRISVSTPLYVVVYCRLNRLYSMADVMAKDVTYKYKHCKLARYILAPVCFTDACAEFGMYQRYDAFASLSS